MWLALDALGNGTLYGLKGFSWPLVWSGRHEYIRHPPLFHWVSNCSHIYIDATDLGPDGSVIDHRVQWDRPLELGLASTVDFGSWSWPGTSAGAHQLSLTLAHQLELPVAQIIGIRKRPDRLTGSAGCGITEPKRGPNAEGKPPRLGRRTVRDLDDLFE